MGRGSDGVGRMEEWIDGEAEVDQESEGGMKTGDDGEMYRWI